MKRIVGAILFLISLQVSAQLTGGTITPTTKFQPFNKQAIATGQKSLDAKYKYLDTINGYKERPFTSPAEANSYIPTNQRTSGLHVLINTGGTLSAGVISGGTNARWWYQNCIADSCLVPVENIDSTLKKGSTGSLGVDFTKINTPAGQDLVFRRAGVEMYRFQPATYDSLIGYIVNSNYKTSSTDFNLDWSVGGVGLTKSAGADGVILQVAAPDFTGQYVTKKWPASVLPYWKDSVICKVTTGAGITLAFELGGTSLPYWARLYTKFNFADSSVKIYLQNNPFTPSLLQSTGASSVNIAIGDRVKCVTTYNLGVYSAKLINLTSYDSISVVQNGFTAPDYGPTVVYHTLLPATTSPVTVESYALYTNAYYRPDFAAVGHSIIQGYAGVSQSELFISKVKGLFPAAKIQVDAMGSMRAVDAYMWREEVVKLKPKYILLYLGANDYGLSDAEFYANYDVLVQYFKSAGIKVIHIGQSPMNTVSVATRESYLKTLYRGQGDMYIEIYPSLKNPANSNWATGYSSDGVHPNATATTVLAQLVYDSIKNLPLYSTTLSNVSVTNYPITYASAAFAGDLQDYSLIYKKYVDDRASQWANTVTGIRYTGPVGFNKDPATGVAVDAHGIIAGDNSVWIIRDGSNTIDAGGFIRFTNVAQTEASGFQLNGNNGVSIWNFNGGWNQNHVFAKNGRVGILTLSPITPLDVNGLVNTSDGYVVTKDGSNTIQTGGFQAQNAAGTLSSKLQYSPDGDWVLWSYKSFAPGWSPSVWFKKDGQTRFDFPAYYNTAVTYTGKMLITKEHLDSLLAAQRQQLLDSIAAGGGGGGVGLPSQTGNAGKYLTTNGTTASWGTDSIPLVIDSSLKNEGNVLGVNVEKLQALHKSITITASTYTVPAGIFAVFCNYAGGTMTVTLPDPSLFKDRQIQIKNFNGSNNVTVTPVRAGESNTIVTNNYIQFHSTGTDWTIMGKGGS